MLESLTNTSDSYAKIVKLIPDNALNDVDDSTYSAQTPFVVIKNEGTKKTKHVGVFFMKDANKKPLHP